MQYILVTGPAGDSGSRLRKLLKGRLSRLPERPTPKELAPDEAPLSCFAVD